MLGGRYRLESMLGATGMGEVWRATDTQLTREVAVKRVRCRDGDIDRACRRLWREARIAAGIRHPHIVAVFDVVIDDGEPWLVMEYVRARNLGDAVAADGPMEPRRAARIGAQLATSLDALRGAGVVHGDVKPGNILLTDDDTAKLTDFGIARATRPGVTMTDLGLLCGTPAYLPPEVARGEEPSAASDVFSLGASLYAAVEGMSPYGDADDALVVYGRARGAELMPCRRAGPLTPVLRRMLSPDPRRRPDAAGAARLLAEVAAGVTPRREPLLPLALAVTCLRTLITPWRAALAAGMSAAIALGAILLVDASAGHHGATRTTRTTNGEVAAIGDPRTVDPCALADQAALARFGAAELTADYGAFDRCDVLVQGKDGSTTDVEDEFQNASSPPPPRSSSDTVTMGGFGVERPAGQPDECDRFILLSGGYSVAISASQDGSNSTELCAMADSATQVAVSALGRGTLPRRHAPAASLVRVNACDLLDDAALAKVPGVNGANPEAGFGDWDCYWENDGDGPSVELRFDQNDPLAAPSDGTQETLGGRQAFVQPGGDGGDDCLVRVVTRRFTDASGQPTEELLYLVVAGDQPPARLCQPATSLAAVASITLTHEESDAR
jgi:tRNA A-37 threonylcarbamoyl transferase component Bud32